MKKNRQIISIDDLPPEAVAMLQALYSRDPQSVTEHLVQVKKVGPKNFMAKFYVGYGHKSIGDCGTTTLFVEQVSLLAAKAIQDWPLYNGQEASTRYLNMAEQDVLNPVETAEGKEIQDTWMQLYVRALEVLVPFLKEQFPMQEGQTPAVYEKAIKAKAFDIARGFLPAGVTTLLSWHTNLRQGYDHLQWLKYHPLPEISQSAREMLAHLKQKYPDSFCYKEYTDQEAYLQMAEQEVAYFDPVSIDGFSYVSRLDHKGLKGVKPEILTKRPQKTELPHVLRKYGDIIFSFPLDFGSFRDLQRHRCGVMMMPLLSTRHGFFKWYLEQLPESFRQEAEAVIAAQEKRIAKLDCSPEVKQNYVAIGYTVACEFTVSLPGSIYVAELRSGQTVHSTLRIVAQQMGEALAKEIPGIALHCDNKPDEWSIKRGTHDITKKAA